jgi:hypothetical protein
VQGTSLQHVCVASHCWPYCEQFVPPPGPVPPLLLPASVPGGGPPAAPQVPIVPPGGRLQGSPEQQSAVVVHPPAAGTHGLDEQMNGGLPAGFGTQGRLQQSALDAQAVPASEPASAQSTPVLARQRGIPRLSWTQFVFTCWTVPEQQRSVALQELVSRRQIEPAGLHFCPWSQRPMVEGGVIEQCVFASVPSGKPVAPQQSLSFVQSSPVGWQPLGGSQMRTPVAA